MANRHKVSSLLPNALTLNPVSVSKECGVKIRASEKDQLIAELRQ